MADIDGLEQQLLHHADGASVADLGAIAAALKAVAEARNTEQAARNKERELRLEKFKSVAALMVPLVALLALFGTTIAQYKQIEAGRQQIEDTEWRDLLTSLKGASDAVSNDPTVAPRLRSFFESTTYQKQAKSIAVRTMGRLSNPEGFTDLFTSVFGEVDRRNIGSVLDTFRTLVTSQQALHSQCNDLMTSARIPFDRRLNDCAAYVDDVQVAELTKQFNVPAQITALRRSRNQLRRELGFVNYKVAAFLRANYQSPRDARQSPDLDLSGTYFGDVNFSRLDLSNFDIAGTVFEGVDLSGAIINPKRRTAVGQPGQGAGDQPDFHGSAWWEAQLIEPTLLAFLMRWYPPYVFPDTYYPGGYQITKEAYEPKLMALCAKVGLVCPSPPRFGPLVR